MSESHRRGPRWSLWLLSLIAAAGLSLATAPAYASPLRPPAPQDALAAVGQVGPTIVDIDTQMGYQSAVGAGTGIVIGPSTILTNNHVIAGATTLTVRSIGNGQTFPGTVIGFDRSHDIAVVQLGGGGLQPANIGNSDSVRVGEPIVSMGNAGGAGGAPSALDGHVIGLNQTVSANDVLTGSTETLNGLIQVDAGIRPGDSGGPTVNAANQVIGLNTAATENFRLGHGQGFVIPINEAMAIAGQIQGGGGPIGAHRSDGLPRRRCQRRRRWCGRRGQAGHSDGSRRRCGTRTRRCDHLDQRPTRQLGHRAHRHPRSAPPR